MASPIGSVGVGKPSKVRRDAETAATAAAIVCCSATGGTGSISGGSCGSRRTKSGTGSKCAARCRKACRRRGSTGAARQRCGRTEGGRQRDMSKREAQRAEMCRMLQLVACGLSPALKVANVRISRRHIAPSVRERGFPFTPQLATPLQFLLIAFVGSFLCRSVEPTPPRWVADMCTYVGGLGLIQDWCLLKVFCPAKQAPCGNDTAHKMCNINARIKSPSSRRQHHPPHERSLSGSKKLSLAKMVMLYIAILLLWQHTPLGRHPAFLPQGDPGSLFRTRPHWGSHKREGGSLSQAAATYRGSFSHGDCDACGDSSTTVNKKERQTFCKRENKKVSLSLSSAPLCSRREGPASLVAGGQRSGEHKNSHQGCSSYDYVLGIHSSFTWCAAYSFSWYTTFGRNFTSRLTSSLATFYENENNLRKSRIAACSGLGETAPTQRQI